MSVYSDTQIREAIIDEQIVLFPLVEEYIRGSSVDVTLGEWFYVVDKLGTQPAYNPYDQADVERYFGAPMQAVTAGEWSKTHKGLRWENIPDDHPIIVLQPGERILAHTHEFIGIVGPGTSEMKARSTVGRNGVVVCKDAGWGDPGYINRWTMEIQNDNDEATVIPVGSRVAQIVFHHTGPVERLYGNGGKYQSGSTLDEIIRSWEPSLMLPRAYLDRLRQPVPIDGLS